MRTSAKFWFSLRASRRVSRRFGHWGTLGVLSLMALTLGACPSDPPGTCESHSDCALDKVCHDGLCRLVCNTHADCSAEERCFDGMCLPGNAAFVDAGEVDTSLGDAVHLDSQAPDGQLDAATQDRIALDLPATDQSAVDSQILDVTNVDSGVVDTLPGDSHGSDAVVFDSNALTDVVAADSENADQGCPLGLHDGGDGECVLEGSCSGGFHDGGDGSCVGIGLCNASFHDGGNGICVPLGSCFPHFSLYYGDADHDGVGAGEQSIDCMATPFAEGYAIDGGDCADDDASVFLSMDLFADQDHDSYTAGAVTLCTDGEIPTGYSLTEHFAPYVSFGGTNINDSRDYGSDSWHYEDQVIRADHHGAHSDGRYSSTGLEVTGFGLNIPSGAVVHGLRVHVVKRQNSGDEVSDILVSLLVQGASVGINHAKPELWPTAYTDTAYGDETDQWGVELTPELLNDPDFGVVLVVDFSYSGFFGDDAYVDNIWLEVFTDQDLIDCDDEDDSVWTHRELLRDMDGDGYGGFAVSACVGNAPPDGLVQKYFVDCYDDNDAAHPGQSSYFSVHRGDGSFDYNCDTVITKRSLSSDTGCSWDAAGLTCDSTGSASVSLAACGHENDVADCVGDSQSSCGLAISSIHTTCR